MIKLDLGESYAMIKNKQHDAYDSHMDICYLIEIKELVLRNVPPTVIFGRLKNLDKLMVLSTQHFCNNMKMIVNRSGINGSFEVIRNN